MGSLSAKNKSVEYLCVIHVFTKYAWIKKPLKDKKAKTVLHGFIKIVNESKRKPLKLWVDQGMQKLLDDVILMYSTHTKEGKSVAAERWFL